MQIGLAINTLEQIAKGIRGWDFPTRLGAYAAFDAIDRDLRVQAKRLKAGDKHSEELHRYRASIEALCGLSAGNQHDESRHISWLLAAADALRSGFSFGDHLDAPE